MTTPASERLYLAQHEVRHEGKENTLFNPDGLAISELPIIYGFNNGGSPGWYSACLVAQDGTGLGGHVCSHEGYMRHDLGILEGARSDRHEGFRKHYPGGYRMVFVSFDEAKAGHVGLDAALKLNQDRAAARTAIAEATPA